MSAVVNAVSDTITKASSGWDPIGTWVVQTDQKNANKILQPIENFSNQIDPLAPAVHKIEQLAGRSISNDPVLQWSAKTVNDTGTAIDAGLKDVGINPDTLKVAIAGFFAPYAVPLLQAAMVKARGGSWEDAAMGAAAAYAAQYVGQMAGDWAGTTASGAPVTTSQVAQEYGISAASSEAAKIAAQNAASLGYAGVATNQLATQLTKAGVSNLTGQLISTGKVDLDKVVDSLKNAGIVVGTSTLLPQVFPNWNQLPDGAKSAIQKSVSGALQGKDPTAIAVSAAVDAAWGGAKDYYKTALGSIKDTYNSALDVFNKAADEYANNETTTQSTYDSLNALKSDYDGKVAQYNDLVQQYNTSGDKSILAKIDELKPQITGLQEQWSNGYTTYQNQLGNYNAAQQQLNASMQQIIDSRREYFDTAAQAINPTADMTAFTIFNKDVQDEMDATGKSASQIFFERQMANPQSDQITSWAEGINRTDPSQVKDISSLYKSATGFDLSPTSAGIDPYTWSVYQDKVAGSSNWYLSEAEKAKQSGDMATYSQLMGELNKNYASVYGESLGYGATDRKDVSDKFISNVISTVLQQKAKQTGSPVTATSSSWMPQVAPTTAPAKTVTSYGFGEFNPYLSDLMTEKSGANKYLRDKYTYDQNAVEARLKNISGLNLSNQPEDVVNQFKSSLPDSVYSGNYLFLPQELQQNIINQFNTLGTSGYNANNGLTALDYLKSGADGGLGSYVQAFNNPYAITTGASPNTGGLNQVASRWVAGSGVTNPITQSMLAKNLIS